MKKYIPFTLKALFYAFCASIPVTVCVLCFSDSFYGRNAASSIVPLWAKVTTVDPSENAQMPDANYLDSRDVVILTPNQFKRTFGHGDVIVVSIEPKHSQVRYLASKGRTTFTTSERLLYAPTGTHIVQTSLVHDGMAIRKDLEPETIASICAFSLGASLISVCVLFGVLFIIGLVKDPIVLLLGRWRYQREIRETMRAISA